MSDSSVASFRVYDASGVSVTFSFTLPTDVRALTDDDVLAVRAAVTRVLANGFTVNAPGAQPGDTVEEVGFVSRRVKNDGTYIIDFFAPNDKVVRKIFSHYLDSDEIIAAFEQATGLKVNAIPVYDGDSAITKDNRNASRYILPVAVPAKVALKDNPRYDPNEQDTSKKKPKHIFGSWLPTTPSLPSNTVPFQQPSPPPQTGAPSASASTPPTAQANGGSHDNADTFGSQFPTTTPLTADALWDRTRALFGARPHFNNWYAKHGDEIDTFTLEEAERYVRDLRWNLDNERGKKLWGFAVDRLEMNGAGILEALSVANGSKVEKLSDWDAGGYDAALAALWAWYSGYNSKMLEDMARKENLSDTVLVEASRIVVSYKQSKKESA